MSQSRIRRFSARMSGIAAFLAMLLAAPAAHGVFHLVVIDELLSSYDGNAEVQFVEMRMLGGFQQFVTNSVFAAFDASGNYVGDILVVPANVTNSGNGVRWLIGTQAFRDESGVVPDFIMPAGILPSGGGMVCFGGGGGISPQNPPNWSRTTFANYIDCVAYGTYSGPTNLRTGDPTPLNPDGHSLQRTGSSQNNLADFDCVETATPQNNASATADLAATAPCTVAETPTETPAVTETATPTATTTPGAPITCVADCDENGVVSMPELIRAVRIALATLPLAECEQADANGNGFPGIDELVRAVASSVNGCD